MSNNWPRDMLAIDNFVLINEVERLAERHDRQQIAVLAAQYAGVGLMK